MHRPLGPSFLPSEDPGKGLERNKNFKKPCIVSINKGTKWDHDQKEKPPVYEFSMEEPAKTGGTHFVKYKRKDFDKFVLYSQRRKNVQIERSPVSLSQYLKVIKLTRADRVTLTSLAPHIIHTWYVTYIM